MRPYKKESLEPKVVNLSVYSYASCKKRVASDSFVYDVSQILGSLPSVSTNRRRSRQEQGENDNIDKSAAYYASSRKDQINTDSKASQLYRKISAAFERNKMATGRKKNSMRRQNPGSSGTINEKMLRSHSGYNSCPANRKRNRTDFLSADNLQELPARMHNKSLPRIEATFPLILYSHYVKQKKIQQICSLRAVLFRKAREESRQLTEDKLLPVLSVTNILKGKGKRAILHIINKPYL